MSNKLKGISDISESTLCDQLEANIIEFFNWGLWCVGAFFNVTKDLDESRLKMVEDPTIRFRANMGAAQK